MADKLLKRLHETLGSISSPPVFHGDTLAIILCTAFEDDGEQNENGWTDAAIEGCEQTLQAIRDHYAPLADLYTDLQARLAEGEAGRQSLFDLWSREKAARFDAETRAEAAEARLAEVEAELRFHVDDAVKAWNAHEAAEAALATARADALREAASVFDELWRENDAVKKAAILALIDNPEPTK